MLLAWAVAAVHGAAVLFMLTGSLVALRWPRVLVFHIPVAVGILALYLTGSDCPLTDWELWLREQAGTPGYTGGFIGHYITEPLGFPIEATKTQIGIYVVALVPNAFGYGLLAVRSAGSRRLTRSEGSRTFVKQRAPAQQEGARAFGQPQNSRECRSTVHAPIDPPESPSS